MKKLTVQFTLEELQELLELVDNQLFRMKYIDSKIPGHRPNPEKLRAATSAIPAPMMPPPTIPTTLIISLLLDADTDEPGSQY